MTRKTDTRPRSKVNKDPNTTGLMLRPYVEPKELAHVDRMRRVTYAQVLEEHVQKHSQTQKPYQNDDYQHMEYAFPDPISIEMPQLPQWEPPPTRTTVTTPPHIGDDDVYGPGVEVNVHYCSIGCIYEQETGELVDSIDPSDSNGPFCAGFGWPVCGMAFGVEGRISDPIERVYFKRGSGYVTEIVRWPSEEAKVCVVVTGWIEWIFGQRLATVGIRLKPTETWPGMECVFPIYNACSCEAAKGYVAPTWNDADSATTINPDGTAYVAVNDGCPPFSWSVSGTDFYMLGSDRDGRGNSLIAGASACGTATITVTDSCGGSVTEYVRCSDGVWDICQSTSGTGTVCVSATEYIEGPIRIVYECRAGPSNFCPYREGVYINSCNGYTVDFPWMNPENTCGDACYYSSSYPAGWKCSSGDCCQLILGGVYSWSC